MILFRNVPGASLQVFEKVMGYRFMKKFVSLVALVMLCLLAGSVSAGSESEKGSECRELLLNRCQSCHYLERICSKVGEKSKRGWKATLKRMVKRRGAELNAGEQVVLLECLHTSDPAILKECGMSDGSQP